MTVIATTTASWATAAATVRGAAHERDGTPGQDVVEVERVDDRGAVVIAVADGAGSASDGGRGAAVAAAAARCAATHALRTGAPPVDAANLALDAAREAVEAEAEAGAGTLGDFATTLAVAVVTRDEVGAAAIGDSVVVVSAGGDLSTLTGETGEYINETFFVTSNRWQAARRSITIEGPVDGVAVFSDGLALLALDAATGDAHAPFFAPLFEFVAGAEHCDAALASFLASPRVRERTDDDVTLAIVTARGDASL